MWGYLTSQEWGMSPKFRAEAESAVDRENFVESLELWRTKTTTLRL